MSLLDLPFLLETRRNHALEHATLKILSPKYPAVPMGGHSNPTGYFIVGDVHLDDLRAAAEEALERLRAGESDLAIHPGCGTNYLVSGGLAALAGALAMLGVGKRWRDKADRLPLAVMLGTVALMFSQPLGYLLQERVTTDGDPGALEIVEIIPTRQGRFTAHRVLTRG